MLPGSLQVREGGLAYDNGLLLTGAAITEDPEHVPKPGPGPNGPRLPLLGEQLPVMRPLHEGVAAVRAGLAALARAAEGGGAGRPGAGDGGGSASSSRRSSGSGRSGAECAPCWPWGGVDSSRGSSARSSASGMEPPLPSTANANRQPQPPPLPATASGVEPLLTAGAAANPNRPPQLPPRPPPGFAYPIPPLPQLQQKHNPQQQLPGAAGIAHAGIQGASAYGAAMWEVGQGLMALEAALGQLRQVEGRCRDQLDVLGAAAAAAAAVEARMVRVAGAAEAAQSYQTQQTAGNRARGVAAVEAAVAEAQHHLEALQLVEGRVLGEAAARRNMEQRAAARRHVAQQAAALQRHLTGQQAEEQVCVGVLGWVELAGGLWQTNARVEAHEARACGAAVVLDRGFLAASRRSPIWVMSGGGGSSVRRSCGAGLAFYVPTHARGCARL